jgi:hypothetical protein
MMVYQCCNMQMIPSLCLKIVWKVPEIINWFCAFFERLPGLKVNFHRSEVICHGSAVESNIEYTIIFICVEGQLSFKYLGVPVPNRRWRNSSEDKMKSKLHTS